MMSGIANSLAPAAIDLAISQGNHQSRPVEGRSAGKKS